MRPPSWLSPRPTAGLVILTVSLDADSRVIDVRVASSPSPILNRSAILAAQQATFATEIVHCAPVPSTYRFSVEFSNKAGEPPGAAIDPAQYLPSTWMCVAADGAKTDETYAFNAETKTLAHAAGSTSETITYEPPGYWHRHSSSVDQRAAAWQYGWKFSGTLHAAAVSTTYVRTDDATFKRSTTDGFAVPSVYVSETWTRTRKPASP